MPKNLNPIRKLLVKQSLLKGNSQTQALLDGGLSESTAKHRVRKNNTLLNVVKKEIMDELNDDELQARLKNILRLKLQLEEKIFQDAQEIKNFKLRLQTINKTKDNIAEITKTLRLVSGESTENIKINEAERENRINRIRYKLLSLN